MVMSKSMSRIVALASIAVTGQAAMALPVVVNGGFEANTFAIFPGYITTNGPITGWTNNSGGGLNPGGGTPFADNGVIPQGSNVAFIQNAGNLSQVVNGFEVGKQYLVTYRENARSGNTAVGRVTIDATTIVGAHNATPVGGANPYRTIGSSLFTATSNSHTLTLSNVVGAGDNTILLDDVRIREVRLGTLFTDNFNTNVNSNVINPSANDQPGRQTPFSVNYTEQPHSALGGIRDNFSQVDNGEFPDALLLAGDAVASVTTVSPNINFKQIGSGGELFVVEYQVNPIGNLTGGETASSWAAGVVGSTSQTASVNTSDGVGMLIRGNGGFQIFDGTAGANVVEAAGDLGTDFGITEGGFYDVRFEYFVSAFNDVNTSLMQIFVDNVLVRAFNTRGGFANNHVVLVGETDNGQTTTHGFDNLRISSTFIPEPATATMAMLGVMGLLARRRRQA